MLKDALTPQARHHFTRFDQVNQLGVGQRSGRLTVGFMARMMVLCSLPRTNPGNRKEYKRVNGPYTLYMYGRRRLQAPLWQHPAPVDGLALIRSSADPKPRDRFRRSRFLRS